MLLACRIEGALPFLIFIPSLVIDRIDLPVFSSVFLEISTLFASLTLYLLPVNYVTYTKFLDQIRNKLTILFEIYYK